MGHASVHLLLAISRVGVLFDQSAAGQGEVVRATLSLTRATVRD
jgi:hypothetical protein